MAKEGKANRKQNPIRSFQTKYKLSVLFSARLGQRLQTLRETPGMRFFGLGQRLKPIGDFREAFFTRRLAMPGYISVYSCVSPAMAAFRLSVVGPMGRPVAGSPTLFI